MVLVATTVDPDIRKSDAGILQIRFFLDDLDDAGKRVFRRYHRTTLLPGGSLAEVLAANERSIADLGYPAIPAAQKAQLGAIVAREHTPEVVAAYRARYGV